MTTQSERHKPQLLTVEEAAKFLHVDREVVEGWIEAEKVPYVRCHDGQVLMPLGGIQVCIVSEGLLDDV